MLNVKFYKSYQQEEMLATLAEKSLEVLVIVGICWEDYPSPNILYTLVIIPEIY